MPARDRVRAVGETQPVVVALDCGTSKIRAALVSLSGEVLRIEESSLGSSMELVANEPDVDLLWKGACRALRKVCAGAADIRAVGIACQLVQVFLSEEGSVLRAFGWHDQRAVAAAAALATEVDDTKQRRLGRALTAETVAARARWLAENDPHTLKRCATTLWLKDVFVYRLTGVLATDETHASYTGLFRVEEGEWDFDLIKAAGLVQDQIPRVLVGSEAVGRVRAEASTESGLPAGVPVAAGGPDGTLGALGAGVWRTGHVVDVAGTTDVVFALDVSGSLHLGGRAVVNRFCLPGLFALGGPTGLTGGAVRWLSELLRYPSVADLYRTLRAEAGSADPDTEGPIFVPCLTGSRYPTWDALEAGGIVDLRPHHSAAALLRAAEEGAAFVVREGLEVLGELGTTPEEVAMVGGSAREEWVLRVRAAIFGVPVRATHGAQATLRGAAALAAVAAGVCGSVKEVLGPTTSKTEVVCPDPRWLASYDTMYARWKEGRNSIARSR